MKQYFLSFLAVLIFNCAIAQTDYSGHYGYSFDPQFEVPKGQKESGAYGTLSLYKVGTDTYKFWLEVNKGYPSYNSGSAEGVITVKGDNASYDNTFESSSEKCILKFKFTKNKIEISCTATEGACGFGHGVYADGDYDRLKKQPKIDKNWIKKKYTGFVSYEVTAAKATIYDSKKLNKSKNQYFIKGDMIVAINETDTAVYTEFIAANGKFIYGWLKKSELNMKL